MDKLEGLELRKAALTAAGWTVEKRPDDIYVYTNFVIKTPLGETISSHFECDSDGGDYHDFDTEADAWQHAPAVESSVDAALEWLKLPRYHQWELYPLQSEPHLEGQGYSEATIYSLLSGDEVASGQDEFLSVAMCDAYRRYKAGA